MGAKTLSCACVLSVLGALALIGCKRAPSGETSEAASASAAPATGAAPFTFRDDTEGVLLTWVDATGDFHITSKTADVPAEARGTVRVVLRSQPAGSLEYVYVTDLDKKASDGSYPVRLLERAKWEELGASRRKERMDRLAPPAPSAAPSGPLAIVIYGASWCKPCHMAEDYLRGRGLNVTKKDIEESDANRAEMQEKLQRAGLSGSQIPVIDVGGTMLVGFSTAALDAAVQRAEEARRDAAPATSK